MKHRIIFIFLFLVPCLVFSQGTKVIDTLTIGPDSVNWSLLVDVPSLFYTADGTLSGKRTVTMGSDSVVFTGTNSIYLRPDGAISANAYYGDGSNLTGISGVDIYNDDGTLAGARTVTMGGYTLDFSGSPNLTRINGAGQLLVGDFAGSGYTLLGGSSGDAVEIGASRTLPGASYIDFWSDSTTTDFDFRVLKNTGSSGVAQIVNQSGPLWIQNTGSDPLIFRTNATEQMRIDGSGNVGIGTTAPLYPLEINKANGGTVDFAIIDDLPIMKLMDSDDGPSTGDALDLRQNTGISSVLALKNAGNTELRLEARPGDNTSVSSISLNRSTNTTGDVRILGYRGDGTTATSFFIGANNDLNTYFGAHGGYFGIGTASPNALLDVDEADDLGTSAGNTLPLMRLAGNTTNDDQLLFDLERKSAGSTWTTAAHRIQRKVDVSMMGYIKFGSNSSDLITFGEDATEYVRIDGSGNVGIGTGSPSAKLDVVGTLEVSGAVDFTGYGSGSQTGTAAYMLAVDGSGNMIEEENRHDIAIQVVNRTTEVATGESEAYFVVSREHEGLTCTHVEHRADSGTGSFDLQIRKNDTLQGSAITVNGITSIETDIADFTIAKGDVIDANISAVATPGLDGLTITISCK